ncbi:MAG: DUF4402 domain-containing protein [Thermoanaerobaculia bacterium]
MTSGNRCLAVAMFIATAALSGTAIAQPSTTLSNIPVAAAITDGIGIANTAPLAFGDMLQPTLAGTVTVSPAGARTASGSITLLGSTVSAAGFFVDSNPGNRRFWVVVPSSVTISAGAATMTVTNFQTNVANPANCVTTGAPAPGPPGQCPNTSYNLSLGGTLNVGAAQAPGLYSGTFSVTVNRF